MTHSKALFQHFTTSLASAADPEEIHSIGLLVFGHLYGFSRTDIMANKPVADPRSARLEDIIRRLHAHEPIQYILGEADFFGRVFGVSPAVLIPRPETEELVQQVMNFIQAAGIRSPAILDVGAGSGCISITLAVGLPQARVFATDVSAGALAVATKNAERHKVYVNLSRHDILTEPLPAQNFDVIVSNPPYITLQEKTAMKANVLAFEPHLALFVTGNDPLLFYRAIARKAKTALRQGGMLAFEINAGFGPDIAALLHAEGFNQVAIVKDLQGKDRIGKGILS